MIVGTGDEFNIVGTTHDERTIKLLSILSNSEYFVSEYSHNHPSGNPCPSGQVRGPRGKDIGNAPDHEKNILESSCIHIPQERDIQDMIVWDAKMIDC